MADWLVASCRLLEWIRISVTLAQSCVTISDNRKLSPPRPWGGTSTQARSLPLKYGKQGRKLGRREGMIATD